MMARCVMMCVIEANCTNVHDPGQKMVFGAQKSLSRIFSEKMPKIAFFYVARNCVHRKHVDRTNLFKLFRSVCCVLKTVCQVYFIIQSSQLLLPLPFKPGNPSFLRE